MKDEIKKVYTEILEVCNKYKNETYLSSYDFDDIRDMAEKAENHLIIIDWYEKYGLDIPHDRKLVNRNHCKVDDYMSFTYFENAEEDKKNGMGRYISWSDDDRQPRDEWLLNICFPTGAYIFGTDYPEEIFQEFWHELRSYKPQYIDTVNHHLYFSMDNANKIYSEFKTVLHKYYEKNKLDEKERKIKRLQKELEELNNK